MRRLVKQGRFVVSSEEKLSAFVDAQRQALRMCAGDADEGGNLGGEGGGIPESKDDTDEQLDLLDR